MEVDGNTKKQGTGYREQGIGKRLPASGENKSCEAAQLRNIGKRRFEFRVSSFELKAKARR